jgi:hypothetical protein
MCADRQGELLHVLAPVVGPGRGRHAEASDGWEIRAELGSEVLSGISARAAAR